MPSLAPSLTGSASGSPPTTPDIINHQLLQMFPPPFLWPQLERTHFHDFMIGVHTKLRHYAKLP